MPRLRTFIAIDPGKAIRDQLVGLQEGLARSGVEVKWVESDNLHVTLLCLGEVELNEVPAVCDAVAGGVSSHKAFNLSIAGVGCFPNPRRPRVVWAGVGQGAQEVCAVHDAIEKPLLELGCYRREDRRNPPHITLGLIRGERSTRDLATALAQRAGWKGGDILVREIHVMSSELTPDGPVYTVLSRAKLNV
jgi:2'-5' RNA ligase